MQPQTWVSIVICLGVAFLSILLLAQGYVNLKTGKISRFGLDAFWHHIDIRFSKSKKQRYNSNLGVLGAYRKTGLMAILIAFVLAKTAIGIFINNILPFIN